MGFFKQKNIQNLGYIIIWTILSFLTIYFFEVTISPRYELYYGDCSVFKTVANAWLEGKIPYRDIFDHKGPYQYLINVVGLLISEKWGLLLLSVINLSIVSNLLWALGRLWLRPLISFICTCIFLGCYICVISGGNMTESWCLLFCVLPLYIFCRRIQKNDSKWWDNIIYGFCFGVIAFIRINNGIIPASIILVLFIRALRKKQLELAFKQIGLQILGFLLAVAPMIIYFWSKGALYDMIYANYIFNMEYMAKWTAIAGDQDTFTMMYGKLRWLFPVIILFFWSLRQVIKKKKGNDIDLMLTMASGVTILANIKSMSYLHYYITFLPLIMMLAIKTAKIFNKNILNANIFSKTMISLSVLWFVVVFVPTVFGWALQIGKDIYKFGLVHGPETNPEIENVTGMIERNVPAKQMNDIYNVGTYDGVAALLRLDALPAGKYFFLQGKLSKVSDKVANEIDNYTRDESPAFILTDKESFNTDNPSLKRMFERYEVVDSANHSTYLMKLSHNLHD